MPQLIHTRAYLKTRSSDFRHFTPPSNRRVPHHGSMILTMDCLSLSCSLILFNFIVAFLNPFIPFLSTSLSPPHFTISSSICSSLSSLDSFVHPYPSFPLSIPLQVLCITNHEIFIEKWISGALEVGKSGYHYHP